MESLPSPGDRSIPSDKERDLGLMLDRFRL